MSNSNIGNSKQNPECLDSAKSGESAGYLNPFDRAERLLAYIVSDFWRACADTDAIGVVVSLLAWRALHLVGAQASVGLVRGLVTAVRRDYRLHLVELDAWTWYVTGHPAEAETLWSRLSGAVASAERDGEGFIDLARELDAVDNAADLILSAATSSYRGEPFASAKSSDLCGCGHTRARHATDGCTSAPVFAITGVSHCPCDAFVAASTYRVEPETGIVDVCTGCGGPRLSPCACDVEAVRS